MGRRQRGASRDPVRGIAREGHSAPRGARSLRRRCVRRSRPEASDRRPGGDQLPLPRALRADDVHRSHGGRAARLRAASARLARAGTRGGARGRRDAHRHVRRTAPVSPRDPDRRHLLRGRDQEGDLHVDERPAAARGRVPDALLGERRRRGRRRGLLRSVGHRKDDALGRPRAPSDRRRRTRLGRRRRLQLRRRLLRQGDPVERGSRARDLQDDALVRDDPRERRPGRERERRSRRRLEDREHASCLQARADREPLADEARRPPEVRALPHRGRVWDLAA